KELMQAINNRCSLKLIEILIDLGISENALYQECEKVKQLIGTLKVDHKMQVVRIALGQYYKQILTLLGGQDVYLDVQDSQEEELSNLRNRQIESKSCPEFGQWDDLSNELKIYILQYLASTI